MWVREFPGLRNETWGTRTRVSLYKYPFTRPETWSPELPFCFPSGDSIPPVAAAALDSRHGERPFIRSEHNHLGQMEYAGLTKS